MKLNLSVDQVLTTTRSVRKRLDVTRPVRRADIEECLEIAFQAPTGGNRNAWRWIIVDDRALIARIADLYTSSMDDMARGIAKDQVASISDIPGHDRVGESVTSLRSTLHKMPFIVIPVMFGRPEGKNSFQMANIYGSIVQAAWSFFLALRERGMGSAWTTLTLRREQEMADLLKIPYAEYTQIGMFPVAYTIGTEFKKAWRKPVAEVVSYNRF